MYYQFKMMEPIIGGLAPRTVGEFIYKADSTEKANIFHELVYEKFDKLKYGELFTPNEGPIEFGLTPINEMEISELDVQGHHLGWPQFEFKFCQRGPDIANESEDILKCTIFAPNEEYVIAFREFVNSIFRDVYTNPPNTAFPINSKIRTLDF